MIHFTFHFSNTNWFPLVRLTFIYCLWLFELSSHAAIIFLVSAIIYTSIQNTYIPIRTNERAHTDHTTKTRQYFFAIQMNRICFNLIRLHWFFKYDLNVCVSMATKAKRFKIGLSVPKVRNHNRATHNINKTIYFVLEFFSSEIFSAAAAEWAYTHTTTSTLFRSIGTKTQNLEMENEIVSEINYNFQFGLREWLTLDARGIICKILVHSFRWFNQHSSIFDCNVWLSFDI